mgnify:CR=1 FL=1
MIKSTTLAQKRQDTSLLTKQGHPRLIVCEELFRLALHHGIDADGLICSQPILPPSLGVPEMTLPPRNRHERRRQAAEKVAG